MSKITYTCLQCGAKVLGWPSDKRKYCSRYCQHIAAKKPTYYICQSCGVTFQAEKKQTYCSKKCQNLARTTKKIDKVCTCCGKTFTTRHDAKFCSFACYTESRKVIPRKCKRCGKTFIPRYATIRYCSQDCRYKDKMRPRGKCGWCGKPLKALRRAYCSIRCAQLGLHHIPYNEQHCAGYGPNWEEQKKAAKERDGYVCRICGKVGKNGWLHVHHFNPFDSFNGDWKTANDLSNIICLCPSCHRRVEFGKIPCPSPLGPYQMFQSCQ